MDEARPWPTSKSEGVFPNQACYPKTQRRLAHRATIQPATEFLNNALAGGLLGADEAHEAAVGEIHDEGVEQLGKGQREALAADIDDIVAEVLDPTFPADGMGRNDRDIHPSHRHVSLNTYINLTLAEGAEQWTAPTCFDDPLRGPAGARATRATSASKWC